MSDPVRELSARLAQDPESDAYLLLGEALRRRGDLDAAYRIAMRGVERHPFSAAAHDLLARVASDRGDLEVAYDAWDAAASLEPALAAARKGQAFVRFRQGRLAEAEAHLHDAVAAAGGSDAEIDSALARVREAALADVAGVVLAPVVTPPVGVAPHADPARLFADLTTPDGGAEADGSGMAALFVDEWGTVRAGACTDDAGHDVASEVGRALGDIGGEATGAMRHLTLGAWRTLHVEAEGSVVAMAPVEGGGVALVAAAPSAALGRVRRLAVRAAMRVADWRGGPA
jgi:predicted regulator of Ras-like GTPase activity (Roadblock/LC7/MglB family)